MVDYGAPIGNPGKILAWGHREAAAGRLADILLLSVMWLFLTLVLFVVTVLRLRLEPILRRAHAAASTLPELTTRYRSSMPLSLAITFYILSEAVLTILCALYVAHAAGFHWGMGAQNFARLLLRGLWWQGGLAPECYPALLVWGIGTAFLTERAWYIFHRLRGDKKIRYSKSEGE